MGFDITNFPARFLLGYTEFPSLEVYIKAKSETQSILLKIIAGLGGLLGLAYANRRIKQTNEANFQERFNNALQQFGSTDILVKAMGFEILVNLVEEKKDPKLLQQLINAVCLYFRIERPYPKPKGVDYPEKINSFEQRMLQGVFKTLSKRGGFEKIYTEEDGIILSKSDLTDMYFHEVSLYYLWLDECNLRGVTFEKTDLYSTSFSELEQDINFRNVTCKKFKIEDITLLKTTKENNKDTFTIKDKNYKVKENEKLLSDEECEKNNLFKNFKDSYKNYNPKE